ncbi:MAG: TldD/PmbA family protein [Oligoflexales bacterium]
MNDSNLTKIRKALREELSRSLKSLKVPGHPRPYFLSYLIRDQKTLDLWARYGSLCQNQNDQKRMCYADVRVGGYRYDHVANGGLSDNANEEGEGFELPDMPLEDNPDALKFCLWRLTDARYRDAVKKYHEKRSRDISYLDESKELASFSKMSKSVEVGKIKPAALHGEAMQEYIKAASLVFRDYPEIKNSYVEYSATHTTKVFSSTEGVERVWQESVYGLTAYMWLHSKQCNHDMTIAVHTPNFSQLPSLPVFKKSIESKLKLLHSLEKSDRMTSYAGPVLLAPQPAGLFLHEAIGHRLEGSRLLSNSEGKTFKDKVGTQIMHPAISIYDDPTIKSYNGTDLVGTFPFDDEGTEAQRVCLVKEGYLTDFLNTRAPCRSAKYQMNGHARNQTVERPISRMANLIVESKGKLNFEQMKKRLIEEVVKRKLPYGVILYDVEGGETGTESYNFQAFLGEIMVATKIYPNGKEQMVWGVDFVGTPLATLSQISEVGGDYVVDNSFCGAESGTIPVSTVSPPILINNLELQAKQSHNVTQYVLPLPWWDRG